MILTQCAACAADLGLTLGKKCGRCSTRYCGPECQVQHWKEGGHDTLCKKIKRGGGAEQYHADKKFTEAVTVAAEACAEDTKGQTCYICMEVVHRNTGEGLVRGCACGDRDGVASGSTGVAHVSCLVEEAKVLFAEALENNLGPKVYDERWRRWYACCLCEQRYHGAVKCALGWACWKTYLGRQETDQVRCAAINVLGLCLHDAGHHADALTVREYELSMLQRLGGSEADMLITRANLAMTYQALGRPEQALSMKRDVYAGYLKLYGASHGDTVRVANNYAGALGRLERYAEAKALLRKMMPVARRVLGDSHDFTLQMRTNYAAALYEDTGATLDDLREATTTLEDTEQIARRVLGPAHPITTSIAQDLRQSQAALRARETPPGK